MEPTVFNSWRVRRGDSASLGFVLMGRNVLTRDVVPLQLDAADVIEWAIRWPGAPTATVRKTGSGGDLTVESDTRAIRWTLTPSQTQGLEVGQGSTRVRVLFADGRADTYLTGLITVENGDV